MPLLFITVVRFLGQQPGRCENGHFPAGHRLLLLNQLQARVLLQVLERIDGGDTDERVRAEMTGGLMHIDLEIFVMQPFLSAQVQARLGQISPCAPFEVVLCRSNGGVRVTAQVKDRLASGSDISCSAMDWMSG